MAGRGFSPAGPPMPVLLRCPSQKVPLCTSKHHLHPLLWACNFSMSPGIFSACHPRFLLSGVESITPQGCASSDCLLSALKYLLHLLLLQCICFGWARSHMLSEFLPLGGNCRPWLNYPYYLLGKLHSLSYESLLLAGNFSRANITSESCLNPSYIFKTVLEIW